MSTVKDDVLLVSVKVSELTPVMIDWVIGKLEKKDITIVKESRSFDQHIEYRDEKTGWDFYDYSPSTLWGQGGPIIEREEIDLVSVGTKNWKAMKWQSPWGYGETPLLAAMRCYIAFKYSFSGGVVEVPIELVTK